MNEIYYSINPVETIKNALKKEDNEYTELAKCKPFIEEGKKRMEILRWDIEQFWLSTIKKKYYFRHKLIYEIFVCYHYMSSTLTFSFYRKFTIH